MPSLESVLKWQEHGGRKLHRDRREEVILIDHKKVMRVDIKVGGLKVTSVEDITRTLLFRI